MHKHVYNSTGSLLLARTGLIPFHRCFVSGHFNKLASHCDLSHHVLLFPRNAPQRMPCKMVNLWYFMKCGLWQVKIFLCMGIHTIAKDVSMVLWILQQVCKWVRLNWAQWISLMSSKKQLALLCQCITSLTYILWRCNNALHHWCNDKVTGTYFTLLCQYCVSLT